MEEIKVDTRGARFLIEDTTLHPDGYEILKNVLASLLEEESACLGKATQRDLISATISNGMAAVVSCLISELTRGRVFDPSVNGGVELRKWSREEIHEYVLEQIDYAASHVEDITRGRVPRE
ncbi:hypothetical protein [Raoultella ornithinolytica]|uniref:hypothetical protein n=1 Tax=Raoultella ornithinolytica TaxID=54291 RepID=UPI0013C33138|nr:hypothetical protein [Raoultella ornithinolytica]